MELHETLAQLARDHGEGTFHDADAFRGALDDYLDEGSASTGTINLLTDAVRLGAVQSMISMLDSGATAESAVDSAGRRLSRDRGSADVVGSQWACAVLGFALGRVPASMVSQLRPDAITAEPPRNEGDTAARPQMSPPTHVAPPAPPGPSVPAGPPALPPHVSPPTHAPGPAYPSYPTPAYGQPQPAKSRTGLIIGLVVAAVLVLVLGTVSIIALAGGDDGDNDAGDDPTTEATTSTAPTTGATSEATTETAGALTIDGSGYTYQLPDDEWTDVTADLADQSPTIDTVTAWGRAIETARANLLVETSSAFGESDPAVLKDDWIEVVSGSTGATPEEIEPITIGGQQAVGIELNWTNQHDIDIRQIAYLTVWDGQQYSITMTITQDDAEIETTFYDILDTWVWA